MTKENVTREVEGVNEVVLHGDKVTDEYLLITSGDDLLIVHSNYFLYESAIVFTVGHADTDWSSSMLWEAACKTVDLLNEKGMSE